MNIFIFLEGGINQPTTLEMWHVNPIICFRRDQIQDYSLLNFNEGKQRYIAFFKQVFQLNGFIIEFCTSSSNRKFNYH